jgi:hypothetical protein
MVVSKCLTARGAGGQNQDYRNSNPFTNRISSGCDDGMDTQINVTPTMRVAGNAQGNLARQSAQTSTTAQSQARLLALCQHMAVMEMELARQ